VLELELGRPAREVVATTTPTSELRRIASIDILRGLIMALMALDHTRDFFTDLTFEPETLSKTDSVLFATRWVTHFCAPMFFFLAGTSAFLYGRKRSKSQLTAFLATRGLWLILLEFTLVGTAWSFLFPWGFFGVIWALGASMLILAALVLLPMRWLIGVAVAVILCHDLLDPIRPEQVGAWSWLWGILHARGDIELPGGVKLFVLFPLIPLVAVMAAGYACGQLFVLDRGRRQRLLLASGGILTAAFIVLRFTNIYGNPPPGLGGVSQGDWHLQSSAAKTIILFLDVEKYPPSLQYLLMTLGPSMLLLAALEHERVARALALLRTYGQAPLFFYVAHIYLIHGLAVLVALATGQPTSWLFHGAIFADTPAGYGHGLPFIYFMWLGVLAILYVPCRWLAEIKNRRRDWWLSYL